MLVLQGLVAARVWVVAVGLTSLVLHERTLTVSLQILLRLLLLCKRVVLVESVDWVPI